MKSTIHWVSARHAVDAEVRLYDNLFTKEDPGDESEGLAFTDNLNPHSLEVLADCKVEPGLLGAAAGQPLPVRAAGLLLRGSGLDAAEAGLQPHRSAAGQLGEDRKGAEGERAGVGPWWIQSHGVTEPVRHPAPRTFGTAANERNRPRPNMSAPRLVIVP